MTEVLLALLGGGLLGSFLTYRAHGREIGVKMIEVAIEPEASSKALRDWAVDVLDHYSKHHVRLSKDAKAELTRTRLNVFEDVRVKDFAKAFASAGALRDDAPSTRKKD